MKRWKKIVIWCVSIVVILGISGALTANYMINKFLNSMSESLVADLEQSVAADLETSDNGTADANNGAGQTQAEGSSSNGQSAESNEGQPADEQAAGDSKEGAAAGGGGQSDQQQAGSSDASDNSYTPNVNADKMLNIKDKVTVGEKAKVTTIILGSLSLSDIKELQSLASGGMTVEKKRAARKILMEKVAPEDYNELSQIAKKYGASEGKSYDEIVKQEERRQKEEQESAQS
ncbi:hypothetical protein [Paenibacillus kobensis]|uniref:hypothetical protein n=1 Tax=Paenibacillus kobensis TaxID=59841 RepID=UPI000FD86222|nr:hypothetical protein [Paenibacillus kobensis]